MPTIPPYPPEGTRRCPICDAPYQTCTGHEPGYDTSPQYLIDLRRPRRVPVPIPGATTQAFAYPPNVKVMHMAEKQPADSAAPVTPPRTGPVPRSYPPEQPDAPAEAPAPEAPATDAPAPETTTTRRRTAA